MNQSPEEHIAHLERQEERSAKLLSLVLNEAQAALGMLEKAPQRVSYVNASVFVEACLKRILQAVKLSELVR